MAKRQTVYFGPPLAALTEDLKELDTVSGRINRAAERYGEILKRHGVALTEEERCVLGKCLRVGLFGSDRARSRVGPVLILHLADTVADSEFADQSEARSLIDKLRAASFADLVATVEGMGF